MTEKFIAVVAGTRPEFIKLAPVVRALRARRGDNAIRVYSTGQHRSLMTQAVKALSLRVDEDFDLMTHAQSPAEIQRRIISACDHAWTRHRPDLVIVQGDTVSAMGGAMAAYLNQIPVMHVEAGLRSHDLANPWPEEGMRQMIARIAAWHMAPTPGARDNLLGEGIAAGQIHIVGNPGIDSLETTRQTTTDPALPDGLDLKRDFAIVTMHRREALSGAMEKFCHVLAEALKKHPDLQVLWPIHPNPAVREIITTAFGHDGSSPILFCDPLPYDQMAHLLPKARLVISDSGGMQEEAPYSGVPIAVMRDVTERPEIIDLGLGILAGADGRGLVDAMDHFLEKGVPAPAVEQWRDIQGRGKAGEEIARLTDAIKN